MKRVFVVMVLVALIIGSISTTVKAAPPSLPTIDQLSIGKDCTDLDAKITILTFRTDILDRLNNYAKRFNEIYPNINIVFEGMENYEDNVIIRLSTTKNWGDIMMIPLTISNEEASIYFEPIGSYDLLSKYYNYMTAWEHDGICYGMPSMGNAYGVVYNKEVFQQAGITKLPTTPDEFLSVLKLIKENTDAIPLYTNYADAWPMSCWDAYIGSCATGDNKYMFNKLVHSSSPFSSFGDGTHPYAVYKILYDAVANGLTEEDYTTTSEEHSEAMLAAGDIGCMVFGSWIIASMSVIAGDITDVGYMPFPITVDGSQYVAVGPDYSYGINVESSMENKLASMLFIKWMTECSGFTNDEISLPVSKSLAMPDTFSFFNNCVMIEDAPALSGEENFFDAINHETGLGFNANGNDKGQRIVEHAFQGDKSFDEIMDDWNKLWNSAQDKFGIQRLY